jgi:hypothetical protein
MMPDERPRARDDRDEEGSEQESRSPAHYDRPSTGGSGCQWLTAYRSLHVIRKTGGKEPHFIGLRFYVANQVPQGSGPTEVARS